MNQPDSVVDEEVHETAALAGLLVFFHFSTDQALGGAFQKIAMCKPTLL